MCLTKSEQELGNAFEDVKQNFQGGTGSTPPPYSGGRLKKTARLLHTFYFHWLPVAYTVITSFTNWLRKLILPAREMASRLPGTCCIYFTVIHYLRYLCLLLVLQIGKSFSGKRRSLQFKFPENGTTVLMWCIFGAFLCGIGQFVAMHILIKNSNMICACIQPFQRIIIVYSGKNM